jgi:DNA polymerase-1
MLLTVHDELVFEVATAQVEETAALVKREMESAYELDVPLRADIGRGPNWAKAAPAGH